MGCSTAKLLLALFILTTATVTIQGNDDVSNKFTVVKAATCSNKTSKPVFMFAVTGLLGKLMAETPEHVAKEGGYSFTCDMDDDELKGQGAAGCDKGQNKSDCGYCLGVAMEKLSEKCFRKTSGDVELKGCKMSFKKVD